MKKLVLSILVAWPGLTMAQVLEWSYTLDASEGGYDRACKVLYDGAGGIYILGDYFLSDYAYPDTVTMIVIKLDTLGNEMWRYTSSGEVLGYYTTPHCMILNEQNSIYIAGTIRVDSTESDLLLVRLDTAGNEKWTYQYDVDTLGPSSELSRSLSADSSGNLYIAGRVGSPLLEGGAFLVLSVDTAGNFRWSFIYRHDNDVGGWEHCATNVISDSVGGIYVCGYLVDTVWPPLYQQVFVVVKLDTLGSLSWKWFGPDGLDGFMFRTGYMGLSSTGHLFGVASGQGTDATEPYYFELDTAGNEVWAHNMGAQIGIEEIRDMALTNEGLYSCGYYLGMGGWPTYFVVTKISLGGSYRWERFFWVDTLWATSCANDLGVNNQGNLFAVDDTGDYAFAVKMDSAGVVKWIYPWPERSWFSSVALDSAGGIYIAGAVDQDSLTREGRTDILVIKLRDTVAAVTEPNPSARIPDSMTLSMAPSGFLISGYSGLLSVYDATGRLILSREITGKTLISPLNRGVYFVKAGKQRAKIAVR